MLEKMEKDDEKSSCNQNKPKKKKLKDSVSSIFNF